LAAVPTRAASAAGDIGQPGLAAFNPGATVAITEAQGGAAGIGGGGGGGAADIVSGTGNIVIEGSGGNGG